MSGDCSHCGTEIPKGRELCDPCVDLIEDIVDADREAFERAYERERDLLPYKGTVREYVQDEVDVCVGQHAWMLRFECTPELVEKVTLRIFRDTGLDETIRMGIGEYNSSTYRVSFEEIWRHAWPVLAEEHPRAVHAVLEEKAETQRHDRHPRGVTTVAWPEFDRLEDVVPDVCIPPELRTGPGNRDATAHDRSHNAEPDAEALDHDTDADNGRTDLLLESMNPEDCSDEPAQILAEIERDRATARTPIAQRRPRDATFGQRSGPAIDL